MEKDKNIIEALERIEYWLNEISKTNNANINQTDELNIVLINLKIEDAHIKENTGITPIADKIESVIKNVHDNTDNLVKVGRTELRQAFKIVKKYILEKENVENE
jgi:hypothetical protein